MIHALKTAASHSLQDLPWPITIIRTLEDSEEVQVNGLSTLWDTVDKDQVKIIQPNNVSSTPDHSQP